MKKSIEQRIKEANEKYGWEIKYHAHTETVCLCDKRGSDYDLQCRVLWPETYGAAKQLQLAI